LAKRSLELAEISLGHSLLAQFYLAVKFDHTSAETAARRAVAVDPNDAEAVVVLAEVLLFAGHYDEAIAHLKEAMRLNPGFPERYRYLIGQAKFHMGDFDATLSTMKKFCERASVRQYHRTCSLYRASALAQIGRTSEAESMVEVFANYNLASLETMLMLKFPFKDPSAPENIMVGLRKVWPQ
jgi:tetratricopeptide (TPR) repeat protein